MKNNMKNTIVIIGIVVALVIGGGAGYVFGKGMDNGAANDKKLQDSIVMMKEQSASIQKMGEMMKSGGIAMQEIGTKYKDDAIVSQGKDMEAFGEKYVKDNTEAAESDSMKDTMQ